MYHVLTQKRSSVGFTDLNDQMQLYQKTKRSFGKLSR